MESNNAEANKEDEDNDEDEDEDDDDGDGDDDLFFSDDEETEVDESTETFTIAETLNKVRAIVKFFKSSTVRNDHLQEKVRIAIGHELSLKLDVKHRWNSIHPMLESFIKLKGPIEEVLRVFNATDLFLGIDFQVLADLCSILKPLELIVLALGR